MIKHEVLDFFREFDLHIGDGIDNCSGEDYSAMEEAAEALSTRQTLVNILASFTDGDLLRFQKEHGLKPKRRRKKRT